MSTNFKFQPIPRERFEPALNDNEGDAIWVQADLSPGFPCRVSLQDAQVGEKVLALSYCHHDVASPYRASGPIFIRASAETAQPGINEIPEMFLHRELSVRGYDSDAMMIAAAVTPGSSLRQIIQDIFDNPAVEYLHLHNAGPGCFNCAVVRA